MPIKTNANKRNNFNLIILFIHLLQFIVNFLNIPLQIRKYFHPREDKRSIEELAKWIEEDETETKNVKHRYRKKHSAINQKPVHPSPQIITIKSQLLDKNVVTDKKIDDSDFDDIQNIPKDQNKEIEIMKIKLRSKVKKNKRNSNKKDYLPFEILLPDFKDAGNKPKKSNNKAPISLNDVIDHIMCLVITFLDNESKLLLRQVASRYRKIIAIDGSPTAFFKPRDKNELLLEIVNDENLVKAHPILDSFTTLCTFLDNFAEMIQVDFSKLSAKFHPTNNLTFVNSNQAEWKLLKFYRHLTFSKEVIDTKKLINSVKCFRQFLYQRKILQYKIVFHVEKTTSLETALENWKPNTKGDVYFNVDRFETFFYPIEHLGLPRLNRNSVISILVIPASEFSENNYLNKTDFVRNYEHIRMSKMKQTFIGDCTYKIPQGYRVLTWQVDQNECALNKNRILGIDIALTNNCEIELDDKFLSHYLQDLQSKIAFSNNTPLAQPTTAN